MKISHYTFYLIAVLIIFASSKNLSAQTQTPQKLKIFGDFRFRTEHDWNYYQSDNTKKEDRTRLRYRLRLGFTYSLNDQLSIGGRLRTGQKDNQQSGHITFGDELESSPVLLEKAYVKGNLEKFWGWIGKNSFPFWKQNNFYWDNDVTLTGGAFGGLFSLNDKLNFKPTVGFFTLNSRGKSLSEDGKLLAGQIVLNNKSEKIGYTLGTGYYHFIKLPDLPDETAVHNIDYQLFISNFQCIFQTTKFPVTLGVDVITNLKNYDTDTLIAKTQLQNEKTGIVGSIKLGSLKKKGNILFGYYYAYIPKYAVIDYYAQDDWLRWGFNNAKGSRSSNFKGHEIRLAYAFGSKINIVARTMFVEGIKLNTPEAKKRETANRFRVDINIGF